jgi:hypothetical protein
LKFCDDDSKVWSTPSLIGPLQPKASVPALQDRRIKLLVEGKHCYATW